VAADLSGERLEATLARATDLDGFQAPLTALSRVVVVFAIVSAVRCAIAIVEIIGLTPVAVGSALASPMYTPRVSCSSAHGFATDLAGSVPMRQLLIWWAENTRCPPAPSGMRCIAAMNSSRSSPARQRVVVAANGMIS
jgi:hypothetical protein